MKVVTHIGLTVSDLDKSVAFYRDVLKLTYIGEMMMEGEETDVLFAAKDLKVRVAYLKTKEKGPDIELIQFLNKEIRHDESSLFKTSISEICFEVEDIDSWYEHLVKQGVETLSPPQRFDSTEYGFGKSKAIYFKDPDGIILELMEYIK